MVLPLHHTHACQDLFDLSGTPCKFMDGLEPNTFPPARATCYRPGQNVPKLAAGVLGEIRTHNIAGLSRSPLPIGAQGHTLVSLIRRTRTETSRLSVVRANQLHHKHKWHVHQENCCKRLKVGDTSGTLTHDHEVAARSLFCLGYRVLVHHQGLEPWTP